MVEECQRRSVPEVASAPRSDADQPATCEHEGTPGSRSAVRPSGKGAWLIGPVLLLVALCTIRLVMHGSDRIFAIALTGLLGVAILWILISVLHPAHPDRTCPLCGRDGLRRLDAATTRGIRCEWCGHVDEEQSSFLMAEEEGSIEPIVLRSRSAREARAARRAREAHGVEAAREIERGGRVP